MIDIRPAASRGHANHGWLDTWHSFSFADYYDPARMGWGPLRVINEDVIAPGMGFGMHGHRDMEIITWMLSGELAHRDSLGNGETIHPGEAQRMSAGTGVRHAEHNSSAAEPSHLLQIWIEPSRAGIRPGYEQKPFNAVVMQGRLGLLASPDGAEGSVTIHQDACVYVAALNTTATVTHTLAPGRLAWVQVSKGRITLNNLPLNQGDGAAVSAETTLEMVGATDHSQVLLFDLPPR